MLSKLDAEKLLEFFRDRRKLEELIEYGINELQPDGAVFSKDHVLAFFPDGSPSGLKQLADSKEYLVEFDVDKLEALLKAAKRFGATTVKVSTTEAKPLFIRTAYGVFAIAPLLSSGEGDEQC